MQRYGEFSWPWHLWHDMGYESSELRLCWIWGNQFAELHGGTRAERPSCTWCGTVRTRRIIPPQDFSSPLLINHRLFSVLIIDVCLTVHATRILRATGRVFPVQILALALVLLIRFGSLTSILLPCFSFRQFLA